MISEFVIYRGKEYEATILSDHIWIRSKSSEVLWHGFTLQNGVYCKTVTFSEIDAAYRIDKYAIIDGIRCSILRETANEVTVIFDNVSVETARYYGLNDAYDPGMYRKTYPKSGLDFEIVRTEYDLKTGRYKQTEPVRQIITGGKETKQIEKNPNESVRSTDSLTENVAQIISQNDTERISFLRMDYEEWFKFDIKLSSDSCDHTNYLGSVGIVSNSNHDIVLVDRNANDLKDIVFKVSGQVLRFEVFNQILQYAKQHNKLSDKVANKCFKKAYQKSQQAASSGKYQQQNRKPKQTMNDIVEQENGMHGR